MALFDIPLDKVTQTNLRSLIVAGAEESRYIDYKHLTRAKKRITPNCALIGPPFIVSRRGQDRCSVAPPKPAMGVSFIVPTVAICGDPSSICMICAVFCMLASRIACVIVRAPTAAPTKGTAIRARKGESLQQVADAIKVSKPHIWELETEKSKNPSLDLLTKIAQHFDVSISYLLDDSASTDTMIFGREFKGVTEEDKKLFWQMAEKIIGKKSE